MLLEQQLTHVYCLSVWLCVSVLRAPRSIRRPVPVNYQQSPHPASVSVRTPAAIVGPASSSTPRPASGASKAVE